MLSGGQRQRVALARAVAFDPEVLVLQDPTTAVDSVTEQNIADRLSRQRADKITLVFSEAPAWHAVAANHLSVADLLTRTDELSRGGRRMSETTTDVTPPAKPHSALRFPLATAGQVRREVARQLGTVPHARWWFLLAVVLLGVGSYATVLVPQLMGQIVDLVTGDRAAQPMWLIGSRADRPVRRRRGHERRRLLSGGAAVRARDRQPAPGHGRDSTGTSHAPGRGRRHR